jgi:hypothetical protein
MLERARDAQPLATVVGCSAARRINESNGVRISQKTSAVGSRVIYRVSTAYHTPLLIISPGPCGPGTPAVDPQSSVPVIVDASKFPFRTKLEFYAGARKLGAITLGAATEFSANNLTSGYYVLSVVGTDAAGTAHTSDPGMIFVRALP